MYSQEHSTTGRKKLGNVEDVPLVAMVFKNVSVMKGATLTTCIPRVHKNRRLE